MLSNAKSVMLAVVLWLVENPTHTAVLVVFGLITVLTLSVVLMPESSAIAASASAGSP